MPVWGATVGYGSFLTAEFGAARSFSYGELRGEMHLWIYGADWQIEIGHELRATSADAPVTMESAAQSLNGRVVLALQVDEPSMAMRLAFSGDASLAVTPLLDPELEEWMLWLPEGNQVLTAGPGPTFKLEDGATAS